jgi:hypothetical protein
MGTDAAESAVPAAAVAVVSSSRLPLITTRLRNDAAVDRFSEMAKLAL